MILILTLLLKIMNMRTGAIKCKINININIKSKVKLKLKASMRYETRISNMKMNIIIHISKNIREINTDEKKYKY